MKELRSKLSDLHEELKNTDHIEDDARELLLQLATDIQRLLEPESPDEQPHDFKEQVEDAARRFEASHPTLAGVIQKLGDALAQSGI